MPCGAVTDGDRPVVVLTRAFSNMLHCRTVFSI